MALTADPAEPLTVDEWIELAEREGWRRVELEDGKVVELSPIHNLHATTSAAVRDALADVFGRDRALPAGTVALDGHTAFDPDVVVVRDVADLADDRGVLAAGACVLVVEVAVSSVARDLGTKVTRYARAGIGEYWVVRPDPGHGTLIRHTQPTRDGYEQVEVFDVGHRAAGLDAAAILSTPTDPF